MQLRLSQNLTKALNSANEAAVRYSNPEIGTEHLLFGLLSVKGCGAERILSEFGVSVKGFEQIFAGESRPLRSAPEFTVRVRSVLTNAYELARANGETAAKTEYALLCMLDDPSATACTILRQMFRVDIGELFRVIAMGERSGEGRPVGASERGGDLPESLNDIGTDLTQKARENKIDPVIGRAEEIERIIQILCRKTKNNPVLIGEPGVGKSAVVEGLARQIIDGNVPELLKDKIIFALDMGSLIAGTKYRGEMEQKLKNAIAAVKNQKNIIIFIDELHTLAQSGHKDGEVSPADILKPYLSRGELQTIGATTTDEYRKFIEKDKALERRFQPIIVSPPTVEQTITILKGLKANYESFHKVELTDDAIEAAAKLSDRYIMDRFLPDKAIDLIDEAMSKAKVSGNTVPPRLKELEDKLTALERQKKDAIMREDYTGAAEIRDKREKLVKEIEGYKLEWSKAGERAARITAEEIAEVVSKWTKIPLKRLSEGETARLVNLEKILHERVVGQDKAVESIAKAIRRARAGLKDISRPIGTFLFLGPTGVGKTELTKALGEAMFDDENAVVRVDMSEYMEPHSVSKLIGSPPGYVGFDDGGQLTEQVRRKPYCVVLFDEIEKAHPDVYNLMLQLLDDGRLTDSQGRTVSFKNTIVIMTSNVGVSELKGRRALGFGGSDKAEERDTEEVLTAALKRQFRPEFLNRIDVISIFKHLTKDDLKKIAGIMLNNVRKTLGEKEITLNVSAAMLDFIIEKGYDAEYGARPLRRVIQQYVEDALAEEYLSGRVKDGQTVNIDFKDGKTIIATA